MSVSTAGALAIVLHMRILPSRLFRGAKIVALHNSTIDCNRSPAPLTTPRSICRPRIVCAERPDVPFGILAGVVAPAVVLRHRLARDLGARRLGAREVRVRVGDDAVDAHGDPARG